MTNISLNPTVTLCIFLTVLLITVTPANATTVCVYGTVTDSEGTVVPNTKITFNAKHETVIAYSDSNGFYELFLSDNPSGIHDSETPVPFELSQNFPNPFNPSTTITFSLTQSTPVRLNIYSVTGQHVTTLVDDIYGPGNHSVVWDGRDAAGRGVSAGMYLYRLQAGSQMAAKKMLLLDGGGSPGIMQRPSAKAAATLTDREYEIIITKKKYVPSEYPYCIVRSTFT